MPESDTTMRAQILSLEKSEARFTASLEALSLSFKLMSERIDALPKTNWKLSAGWVSVLVTIIMLLGGAVVVPINSNLVDLKEGQASQHLLLETHSREIGHPPMVERVDAINKAREIQVRLVNKKLDRIEAMMIKFLSTHNIERIDRD